MQRENPPNPEIPIQSIAAPSTRQRSDRRKHERRNLELTFNSPEWIDYMQSHFLLWPKLDRRKGERRSSDRRSETKTQRAAFARTDKINQNDILSEDERLMIQGLFTDETSNSTQ